LKHAVGAWGGFKDIEASIARYLVAMDTADRREPTVATAKTERLQHKIAALKEQMRALKEVQVQLNEAPDNQVSIPSGPGCALDEDARHRSGWLQRPGSGRCKAPSDRCPRGD
jgi:hypothetical protein